VRALPDEYSPHIVGARAQLTGHAVAIDRDDRGRLRQPGELLFKPLSPSFLCAERIEQCLRRGVTRKTSGTPINYVVDYVTDNWLRCWFAGLDARSVKVTTPKKVEDWQAAMTVEWFLLPSARPISG